MARSILNLCVVGLTMLQGAGIRDEDVKIDIPASVAASQAIPQGGEQKEGDARDADQVKDENQEGLALDSETQAVPQEEQSDEGHDSDEDQEKEQTDEGHDSDEDQEKDRASVQERGEDAHEEEAFDLVNRTHCPTTWTDSKHFDCQLYVGAHWCTPTGGEGYGWCEKRRKCSKKRIRKGGYHLKGHQRRGWGGFKRFKDKAHPLMATQVCAGCGANCPAMAPVRPELNIIADGCLDYSAPNKQVWRGSSGYTCGAYHHGGFCVKKTDGTYGPGTLMEGYGPLKSHQHFSNLKKHFKWKKMSPLEACCTCGGGSTCPNGWKLPADSTCVREFVYKKKVYSGCTKVGRGRRGWCSHNRVYVKNEWSYCEKCDSGR